MLTLAQMLKILNEKNEETRNKMIADLPDEDKEALLKKAAEGLKKYGPGDGNGG